MAYEHRRLRPSDAASRQPTDRLESAEPSSSYRYFEESVSVDDAASPPAPLRTPAEPSRALYASESGIDIGITWTEPVTETRTDEAARGDRRGALHDEMTAVEEIGRCSGYDGSGVNPSNGAKTSEVHSHPLPTRS